MSTASNSRECGERLISQWRWSSLRAAVGAAAGIAALALAGSALGSFSPKLVASTDVGSTTVRLGFVLGADDDPAAKVEIYVPAGYQVATPAAGTKLGGLQATGVASDLGSSLLPLAARFVFLSTVTENGRVPAAVTVTTTVAGKRVGGTTGSFELPAGKSATITAAATIDRQTAVPAGQTAANQLYFADLGSSLCIRSPFLGAIPCLGATSAATTITAKTTVTAFKK